MHHAPSLLVVEPMTEEWRFLASRRISSVSGIWDTWVSCILNWVPYVPSPTRRPSIPLQFYIGGGSCTVTNVLSSNQPILYQVPCNCFFKIFYQALCRQSCEIHTTMYLLFLYMSKMSRKFLYWHLFDFNFINIFSLYKIHNLHNSINGLHDHSGVIIRIPFWHYMGFTA